MSQLPLERYRIVDFGTAWAGPMAAQLLADMGAEVVKVESRARMDGLRLGRPIVGEDISGGDRGLWPELQPVYHSLNRNKMCVTVNIKHPEGLGLVKDLIARSDVVLNNFSPGVLQRAGLSYQELRAVNPDIIVVSMPAAGETGPLKNILAYAPIVQALSGLMSLVGYRDEPLVGEMQSAWSDAIAALHAALAAVTALRHRNLTGEGQYVEVSQIEATTALLGEPLLDYEMNQRVGGPQGNQDPEFAPHNNYPCLGDDRWVAIAVKSEEEWLAFCNALGQPDWTQDPRFADKPRRLKHLADLDRHISEWTRQRSAEEITGILQEAGVAAMTVMNIEDQFQDAHFHERQAFIETEHPYVGAEWLYGLPWLLSDTPVGANRPAPLLGQHNEYVFCQLLGLPQDELRRLEEEQAVY